MDAGYFGSDRSARMRRQRVQSQWATADAPTRHLDPILIVAALALSTIGIVAVFSATQFSLEQAGQSPTVFAARQGISLILAIIAMIAFAFLDYRIFRVYSWVFWVGAIVLLVAVLTPLGTSINGAQRWIVVGPFQIQPSEIAKLAVILVLAAILHEREGVPNLASIAVSLLAVALPMGLIFLEPDLGTAIVFVWLTFVLFLVGGVPYRYLVLIATTGAAAGWFAFQQGIIKPYQLDRILAFLDAGSAELAQSSGFHANQAQIAIGSGQFFGKGLFEGTQNKLAYVPENHTDFIFTVIGEETGFFGAVVVLSLFAVLLFRGLRIAMLAKDVFGRLVAAGTVALIALQLFVNVGMTIGLMPVTGIPLPFISYGTNALIVEFALIGLLLNVHMRRFT